MEIELSQLKEVCNILFDYLNNLVDGRIRIPHDRYWDIRFPERYDEDNANPPISGPKLSRDWSDLEKILHRESDPQDKSLVSLSALLRAIGDTIGR